MSESEEEHDISTQEEDKCVREAVKVILTLDHTKKPFKHNDILKCLSKKPNRKQWNTIISKSATRLSEMGLTLVETKKTSSKSFILVSNNFSLSSLHYLANENEVADRTLLILVLTYIFMKQGNATNVDVFNHLKELNIYDEENPIHGYFGDLKKKILNEFVSQLYLEKITDNESDKIELKWGERALAEVPKKVILDFVCKIGYKESIQPKHLWSHYQAARDEGKTKTKTVEDSQEDTMVLDS